MKNQEAINYLNNLKIGMFCTINIPLYNNKNIPVTVMYNGKDKEGRYKFIDTGKLVMSEKFIEENAISFEKEFDFKKANEIYNKQNKRIKKEVAILSSLYELLTLILIYYIIKHLSE